jgi:hypothetical protein
MDVNVGPASGSRTLIGPPSKIARSDRDLRAADEAQGDDSRVLQKDLSGISS